MLSKFKYTLIINTLLVALIGYGQSTFNNYYASGTKSSAFKVQVTNANDYLISSYYIDISGQQGLDVQRLSSTGASLQHKTFLFGNVDFLSFGNNRVQCNISSSTMLLTGAGYTGTTSTIIFASVNKTNTRY